MKAKQSIVRISATHCAWRTLADGSAECVRCGRPIPPDVAASVPLTHLLAACKAPEFVPPWRDRWNRARARLFWKTARARMFAAALWRVARALASGQRAYVWGSDYRARWAKCSACEHRKENVCTLCSCYLQGAVFAKLRMATERCPAEPPRFEALK